MGIQLDMIFSMSVGGRPVGWSEVMYLPGNDLKAALSFVTGANSYTTKRCNLLGEGIINTYNKLTLIPAGLQPIGPQRRSVLMFAGLQPNFQVNGTPFYNPAFAFGSFANTGADFPQVAFMLRFISDIAVLPEYTRTYWLCGLPDITNETDGSRPAPGLWAAPYAKWFNEVTSGNWSMRVVDRSGANPGKFCSGYQQTLQQYTVTAHGFAQGQQVEAVGWKAAPGGRVPRNNYYVNVVDANTITLQNSTGSLNIIKFGVFRAINLAFPAINNATERGFTNKKKGRVFGELRGRRSTRTPIRA